MQYESPTIEMLGDYEMGEVQGEGIVVVLILALAIVGAIKIAAAANQIAIVNVAAVANVAWKYNWSVSSKTRIRSVSR